MALSILLHILAVIGKILLVLLLLVLALLLLVLLCPIRYTAEAGQSEAGPAAEVRVSWLFRLLQVKGGVHREEGHFAAAFDVYLAGVPLLAKKKQRQERAAKKAAAKAQQAQGAAEKSSEAAAAHSADKAAGTRAGEGRAAAHKKPTVAPGARRQEGAGIPVTVVPRRHVPWSQRLAARFAARVGSVKKKIRHLLFSARRIAEQLQAVLAYLDSESFARARDCVLRQGKALLKAVLPRALCGQAVFGFADPSLTGYVLAGAAACGPLLPGTWRLTPDFTAEQTCFTGHMAARGHIVLGAVAYRALRILINKDVRALIHHIRRKNNGGER